MSSLSSTIVKCVIVCPYALPFGRTLLEDCVARVSDAPESHKPALSPRGVLSPSCVNRALAYRPKGLAETHTTDSTTLDSRARLAEGSPPAAA